MTPFARALDAALGKRTGKARQLADALGIPQERVSQWRHGRHRPLLVTQLRIAELLMDPRLDRVIERAARLVCQHCGRPFTSPLSNKRRRRFCSRQCERQAYRVSRGLPTRIEVLVTEQQRAIDAMCWSCEPEGLCRTADCALRAFSPLALARAA